MVHDIKYVELCVRLYLEGDGGESEDEGRPAHVRAHAVLAHVRAATRTQLLHDTQTDGKRG